jgi:Fe-S-cluster containining protein
MQLQVLAGENFTCQSCTNCCRNWFVELMPGEEEKVVGLEWPAGDPLGGVKPTLRHGGKVFLTRRADGACLFLNEANGLCRIHERFGAEAKPLGCRVFPYQIAPTFKGEATVIGRFDCPTVRRNEGVPHAAELPTLRRLAGRLGMSEGFDEDTAYHLERDQIQGVADFVGTMMMGFKTGEERALFIAYLCEVLAQTDAGELNRETLGAVYGGLRRVVENAAAAEARRPNWFSRVAFRTLLGLYLRRDEDVLLGRAGRVGRAVALMKVAMGVGTFRGLGLSHRAGKVRAARLFKAGPELGDAEVFALLWRVMRNRLESFQFMGPANNGKDFLEGLRSLALLYPLVVAAAKFSAASRGAKRIEEEDVDYAVTVIEHSFGRLPVLREGMVGSIEKLLMGQGRFVRLVRNV